MLHPDIFSTLFCFVIKIENQQVLLSVFLCLWRHHPSERRATVIFYSCHFVLVFNNQTGGKTSEEAERPISSSAQPENRLECNSATGRLRFKGHDLLSLKWNGHLSLLSVLLSLSPLAHKKNPVRTLRQVKSCYTGFFVKQEISSLSGSRRGRLREQ